MFPEMPSTLVDVGRFEVEKNFKRAGTSSEAAAKIAADPRKLSETMLRILGFLKARPSTPDQVSRALGIVLNTARARMTDLKTKGLIEPTGERRPTVAGREAEVYRIVEQS